MISLLILNGAVASVNMLLKRWMAESRSRAKS